VKAPGLGGRSDALDKLAATRHGEPLDLLVVGGGATGAGIALDAAARGVKVGLVERGDFASGTSSKSSKLIHGGLRYLEQREFGLVREAVTERDLLRRLAPHLVEPIPFVLPIARRLTRAKFGVGLWAYDALASFKSLHVHRSLDRQETEAMLPAMPLDKVRGGFLYYDCKTDDARLVIEILIQAVRRGATVVNYAAVTDLDGAADGCAAVVRDAVTGEDFEVRARRVVVAAGVWGDHLEHLAREDAHARLRPSKGVHLVFRKAVLPVTDAAALVPDLERRRMIFVIPWLDGVLVGTTDTAYEGDLDRPAVEQEDRDYLIGAVNAVYDVSLNDGDVAGAFAGLRPLVAGKAGEPADLSRRHAVYDIAPGITGITGGKLTTWRRMAKDVVDRVAEELGSPAKCTTRHIRLGSSNVTALRVAVERRARSLGIGDDSTIHLVRAYGDRAFAVLDVAARRGLAEPLVHGNAPLAAEAVVAAHSEMAVHLSDLLARRTRAALTDPSGGVGSGSRAAELLGAELGWNRSARKREEEAHRRDVEHERGLGAGGGETASAAGA
jgi:glycerol-3-phosphate dehydrogenase